jgi:Novel Ras effector 1 C-terminal SARAH (Sav/Rassf/Hpo) domain
LDREEEEYKNVVRQKYKFLAHKIQEAIDQIKPITPTEKREEQDESEVP